MAWSHPGHNPRLQTNICSKELFNSQKWEDVFFPHFQDCLIYKYECIFDCETYTNFNGFCNIKTCQVTKLLRSNQNVHGVMLPSSGRHWTCFMEKFTSYFTIVFTNKNKNCATLLPQLYRRSPPSLSFLISYFSGLCSQKTDKATWITPSNHQKKGPLMPTQRRPSPKQDQMNP